MGICKRCGRLHNDSKEAIEYHKKRCIKDLKQSMKDPFKLEMFK